MILTQKQDRLLDYAKDDSFQLKYTHSNKTILGKLHYDDFSSNSFVEASLNTYFNLRLQGKLILPLDSNNGLGEIILIEPFSLFRRIHVYHFKKIKANANYAFEKFKVPILQECPELVDAFLKNNDYRNKVECYLESYQKFKKVSDGTLTFD